MLEEGAQIVADPDAPVPMPMIGHVTSSYRSATLGRSIALAVVAGGRARIGETLFVPMPGTTHRVTVTDTAVLRSRREPGSMADPPRPSSRSA